MFLSLALPFQSSLSKVSKNLKKKVSHLIIFFLSWFELGFLSLASREP